MVETAGRWRSEVEGVGASFAAAPEFPVFPTKGRHLKPYEAVAEAVTFTRPAIERFGAEIVVHDILTLAPALGGELLGLPVATLIPHLNPVTGPSDPPFGLGAPLPRSRLGKRTWRTLGRPVARGLVEGMREYDELRGRVGLRARGRVHGALSEELVIVGTYPQLEGRRQRPDHFEVVGPLFWEPPFPEVELPEGDSPLVLVAPSTAQDPDHRLLLAALEGLGDLPLRVIATWNRRPLPRAVAVPANTRLVEWLSYSRTIPHCRAVISHAGHGTLARTLQSGAVPVAVPWSGDQFENAARVVEAGLGVRLPARLLSPGSLSLAVSRALTEPPCALRCRELREWSAAHDGAGRAALLVTGLATNHATAPRDTT